MSDDPEARRVTELLARITRGELSEAEAEELELYAADDPELRATIAARRSQAALGAGWLARVEADHPLARRASTRGEQLANRVGLGLVGASVLAWFVMPLLGAGAFILGLGVLLASWIRANHRSDPYKDIQR